MVTIQRSVVCVIFSVIIGIVGAWAQGSPSRILRWCVQGYIPVPDWMKAVFGLSLPIMANLAKIVGGAIQSVPSAQWEAAEGADDVWLCRDGKITEGSSNNAYIVTQNNEIVTRELSTDILHGITRNSVLKIARLHQLKVVERAFSLDELLSAQEAFSTSASGFLNPVVNVNGTAIGNGEPGRVTNALRES